MEPSNLCCLKYYDTVYFCEHTLKVFKNTKHFEVKNPESSLKKKKIIVQGVIVLLQKFFIHTC